MTLGTVAPHRTIIVATFFMFQKQDPIEPLDRLTCSRSIAASHTVLYVVYWSLLAPFEVVLSQWMLQVYGEHLTFSLVVSFLLIFGYP